MPRCLPGPRLLAGSFLALLLSIASPGLPVQRATAHSGRTDSRPAPGAQLLGAPDEVRVELDAPLAEGSFIQVIDEGFRRVDTGATRLEGDPAMAMTVSLGRLDRGGYTVQWTAVDALDEHRTRGSFTFEVLGPWAWLRAQAALVNRETLPGLVGRYWHILLGSWVLKAGATALAGRWYLRRRAARRAAQAQEALKELWEDEAS